jgi:hypothetical protein
MILGERTDGDASERWRAGQRSANRRDRIVARSGGVAQAEFDDIAIATAAGPEFVDRSGRDALSVIDKDGHVADRFDFT